MVNGWKWVKGVLLSVLMEALCETRWSKFRFAMGKTQNLHGLLQNFLVRALPRFQTRLKACSGVKPLGTLCSRQMILFWVEWLLLALYHSTKKRVSLVFEVEQEVVDFLGALLHHQSLQELPNLESISAR